MKFALINAAAVITLLTTATARADVILINPGTDNRIAQITNVAIAGTAHDGIYNLTFHHGTSYNAVQAAVSPDPAITWTTPADAGVVYAAIKAQVNAFGDVAGTRTDDLLLPTAGSGAANVLYVPANNNAGTNYSGWFTSVSASNFITSRSGVQPANSAWVTATAVPEPSSFTLLSMGAIGLIGYRRRKLDV